MKKVELLSPVGNMETLYYAIHNGADAVYLAGSNYGARKYAKNFNNEEIREAIEYAHLYGVKVYITVNTLVYENELEDCINYIKFLHEHNVDGIIMQDIGLISKVRELFPNLEIHASTQFHNHSKEVLSLLKDLGVKRTVLARELSLDEIKSIDIDIEKEVFIHGALCVSYSGCCLFSSMNGGRSGNRGECVGSCRLPYKLICNNKYINTEGDYLLSTKELNTTNHIKELIESGIASFKIEGRMKSPYYVGYVTRIYRNLIDNYYQNGDTNISKEEITNLKKLFNREFTEGYLFSSKDIMNIKSPNHLGVPLGKVIKYTKDKIYIKLTDDLNQEDGIRFKDIDKGFIVNKLYNDKMLLTNHINKNNICIIDNKINLNKNVEVLKTIDNNLIKELSIYKEKKIPIDISIKCIKGQNMNLIISDRINNIEVEYGLVENAIKRSITESDIKRNISKLGNTPFILNNLTIDIDDNIFINLKDINEIRRIGINKLIDIRKNNKKEIIINKEKIIIPINNTNKKININALVRNEEQLNTCLDNNINNIYVTDYNLYKKYKDKNNIYYRLDRINKKYKELNNEKLLITEYGSLNKYRKNNEIVGDYYLNITNHYSLDYLNNNNCKLTTLSVELNNYNIEDIMKYNKYNVELIVYGRVELMIMKYCPLKKNLNYCNKCKTSKDIFYLEDKFKNKYPIIRDNNCITHIMHYKNIDLLDNIKDYIYYGINNFRIELFDEKEKDIINIIKNIKNKIDT